MIAPFLFRTESRTLPLPSYPGSHRAVCTAMPDRRRDDLGNTRPQQVAGILISSRNVNLYGPVLRT